MKVKCVSTLNCIFWWKCFFLHPCVINKDNFLQNQSYTMSLILFSACSDYLHHRFLPMSKAKKNIKYVSSSLSKNCHAQCIFLFSILSIEKQQCTIFLSAEHAYNYIHILSQIPVLCLSGWACGGRMVVLGVRFSRQNPRIKYISCICTHSWITMPAKSTLSYTKPLIVWIEINIHK